MGVVLALLAALAFGGADQYLGSLSAHPWGADVSLLSAPWLVLPLLAGRTQVEGRRGALVGLACTLAALAGYGLMTLSPVEGAELTVRTLRGFLVSERRVLVGGFVTGPIFGWLGARRWRLGALVAAGLVSLEPAARALAGNQWRIRFGAVAAAEVAAGVLLAAWVAVRR